MRMNLSKLFSRVLIVALSSVPATLLARLHDLPISDPIEARRLLPLDSENQNQVKLVDVPGQTYRGLYRNEYLISTANAEFNDNAMDWNLIALAEPLSELANEASNEASNESTFINESSACTPSTPKTGCNQLDYGNACVPQSVPLDGQWNQSSVLSTKAGTVGPEFFQPLFVIYQLEGKEFLVPANQTRHWNVVPSFNAPPKSELATIEKTGPSEELRDRLPEMIASQLELTASHLLVWAAKLREMKGSRDALHQVANLLEEQHVQK